MKTIMTSLAFAVLALGCGGSSAPVNSASSSEGEAYNPDDDTVCTAEAMICPDGSSVGRTGPNCELAPCPGGEGGEAYNPDDDATVCTAEAMQCQDGSSVGRTGPNCEFAACPTEDGEAYNPDDA